ncbi:phosphoribosylaminoimidazolesuccinocarboxamide synthase [Salinibacterium sp. dk2585]|uniref:phosphoribosylaminoimidazolesuccinocarboxamide synthase n=1 Tax=unclassified Salinibacterium TaxID=2632331 RepID=UPI0011C2568A|nr:MULTISPECIES: phosphoribosylaminoimidazolesuccinocarboxamide synthase [unclassified Salinibacterium]QEE60453.1 phosphoribosylaminoimidazolesuccinocarboxamide synthase [Salinibacterium sp. dk2585]TXK55526.1 phosphoribosylaminoimidazolesuccinocarboxamide synthase [Salinibacterium sp. dk5596]
MTYTEPLAKRGWHLAHSGKVRDLYRSEEMPGRMLVVASDRVSAFDHVLEPEIPGKGELLTALSLFWFEELADVPNHLATGDIPEAVSHRAMFVQELEMFPVECVVRGYLTGSGWKEYQQKQTVCGIPLPSGLSDGDRLPEPIYTPAFKAAAGEHDENITFEQSAALVGDSTAAALRDLSLSIFTRAATYALSRGVILADTKFEFGIDSHGVITLADEVLTSDSSRYWDAERYAAGDRASSFDKQIVRDWLSANWAGEGAPPELPQEIVERTSARYRELIERLTA